MIRPAREVDFPRLKQLVHDCGLAVEGIAYDHWGPVTLVYERQGEIVGFAQALLGMPYAVITELAIDPRFQRRGYAVRLCEHLETVMRQYGVTAWVTFTGEKSDAANALERWGARRVHGTGSAFTKELR